MSEFKGIPVVTTPPHGPSRRRSGEKYVTPQGITAIKRRHQGGRRAARRCRPAASRAGCARRCRRGAASTTVRRTVREHRLATVCEEAKCPNIGECWNAGTATHHADGRGLHARLPLLRGRHRQPARLAGRRGARERGAQRRS